MRVKILAMAIGISLASGCALRHDTAPDPIAPTIPPLTQLLFYSKALQQASPVARVSMLNNARRRYEQHPSAANGARLALAYGQPRQKGYAPENCWRYAHQAVAAAPHHWGAAATAYLHQVQALCRDNDNIREQLHKLRKQLHALNKKARQQRQALARAQAKLQALTELGTRLTP